MAGSALRRLMAEYKQLSQNPPDGKSISWWELFNIFFLKLRTQVLRQDQSLRRTSLNGKLPSLDQRELSLKMGSSLQLCHFLKIILSILLRWNSSQSYFIQTFILMAESASGNNKDLKGWFCSFHIFFSVFCIHLEMTRLVTSPAVRGGLRCRV